mmetsp:Transcript_64553/g.112731  ORF Transcript_64553/g.112731 Transcript_64553/m.112731 type:complete len:460 (+) Transcript_64553:61-1440(+)
MGASASKQAEDIPQTSSTVHPAMSLTAHQKDGHPDVVMKVPGSSQFSKIPNGQSVSVLGEAGPDDYYVQWHGCKGSVKKANLIPPAAVITANPNEKFSEVFLWSGKTRISIPDGTNLPVVGVDVNSAGFFYVVTYSGHEYTVKHANVQISAGAAPPAAPKKINADVPLTSVEDLVKSGAIRFVDLSWLEDMHKAGQILKRRQELPEEAFVPIETMLQFLEKKPYLIFVVSHGWLAEKHPDPKGMHLATLVQQLHGISGVVFWDFMSLFQVPRTHSQEVLFRQALDSMHLVYSIKGAGGYRLTDVPADAENPTPYDARGWTTFETCVLRSGLVREVRDVSRGRFTLSFQNWRAPILPEKFSSLMQEKHFTSPKADREKVIELYYRIWPIITRTEYMGIHPNSDQDVEEFMEALPHLTDLYSLDVDIAPDSISEVVLTRLVMACTARGMNMRLNMETQYGM